MQVDRRSFIHTYKEGSLTVSTAMQEIVSIALVSSALFMTGVIWIVQIAVYPALRWFEREGFAKRHDLYRNRIAAIVTVPMFIELAASIYITVLPNDAIGPDHAVALLLVLVAIWSSTILIQVPLHERLSSEKDEVAIDSLVAGNWLRTILWTLRSIWILVLFAV